MLPSMLAAHGAKRCEQQAGCTGATGRAPPDSENRMLDAMMGCVARRCPSPSVGQWLAGAVQWISRPGPARRRGRGARDGRRPPVVGRQFRPSQPGSTPLLRLTPAFTTEERVARGRRRIGDCTTDGLTGGRAARPPAHDSCAAGPSAKRYYPWKVSGQSAGGHSSSPSWRPWGRLRGQRWAGRWAGAAGGAAHLDP